jgi:hypothetical protein
MRRGRRPAKAPDDNGRKRTATADASSPQAVRPAALRQLVNGRSAVRSMAHFKACLVSRPVLSGRCYSWDAERPEFLPELLGTGVVHGVDAERAGCLDVAR